MSRIYFIASLLFMSLHLAGQNPIDKALARFNSGALPYIDTETAAVWQQKESVIFLDTRSIDEFKVSHLPKAQFIGYKEFDGENIDALNLEKSKQIVVYCSIGVRSEQIGLKLKELGYNNIYNLYGGIFLWYNQNRLIVDTDQKPTRKIHGYDKNWAKFIEGGTPSF